MEKYNEREKEIIKLLVKYKEDFQDLKTLGRFLSEKVFPEDVHLITDAGGTNNLVYCKKEDKRKIVYFIAELSLLIHGLIKDGLLKLIPGNKGAACYVGKIEGFDLQPGENNKLDIYINDVKTNEFLDQTYSCWCDKNGSVKYELIIFEEKLVPFMDILGACTLVSPELEKMVESNFMTMEQKTLRWTRIAAIVSMFGMLGAMTIPFFTSTKINQNQYEKIIKSINDKKIIVLDTLDPKQIDTLVKTQLIKSEMI